MSEKTEKRLKRLIAKKESFFRRLQTIHDLIPSIDEEKIKVQFVNGARSVTREIFETLVDDINDCQLDLDENFIPNYEALSSFDTLHGAVMVTLDKMEITESKFTTMAQSSDSPFKRSNELHPPRLHNSLPPLEIQKFSGNITDWPRYRDLFTSIILNNPRLAGVEKLHYLKTTLSGLALDQVKDFALADTNFLPAWTSLTERFESDRMLAASYFDCIHRNFILPSKPTVENLQSFITRITSNVSGLKNMNLPDLADFLLFSTAIRQLDSSTRKDFESKHSTVNIPCLEDLIKFVKNQCRLIELTSTSGTTPYTSCARDDVFTRKTTSRSQVNRKVVLSTAVEPSYRTAAVNPPTSDVNGINPTSRIHCARCDEPHHLYHCPQFLGMNTNERRDFVKRRYLCYNCLGRHSVKSCKSQRSCHCSGRHHRLLHYSRDMKPAVINAQSSVENEPAAVPTNSSVLTNNITTATLAIRSATPNRQHIVFLGTARALIKNNSGSFVNFRLLIDSASTATFITQDLVRKLGLPVESCTQKFSGLSNNPVGTSTGSVDCVIRPAYLNRPVVKTRAFIIDNILPCVPQVDLPKSVKQFVKGLQLADPEFYKSQVVDMLIGCDILPRILSSTAVPPHCTEIGVLPTIFGHVIMGSLPAEYVNISTSVNNNSRQSLVTYPTNNLPTEYDNNLPTEFDNNLQKLVETFWETENISVSPVVDPSEEFCEQHFLSTHRRTPQGRYIVELPFKCDPDKLHFPQSKEIALQRYYSLESRFHKNTALKNYCLQFMKEYLNLGHMVKATRPGKYFIPYFCVHNPNSITTPHRVVFDASAKRSHVSLNELLQPGPKLQNEVPDVLSIFRIHKFVFCCDISKMYRQTLVNDDHCLFMHIFFRENPEDPLQEYELKTVTYGLTPSSYLAHRVLSQLTLDEGARYPLACSVIRHSSVVDDYLVGAGTLQELLEIKQQLCSLLSAGCFPLNKWLSNSPDFLATLKNSDTTGSLIIRNSDDNNIKVLGLGWCPKLDQFFFSLDPPPLASSYSKRKVLSAIARIYDPLGFTAPMIFLFKCILKDIWLSGVDWDEPIPPEIQTMWHKCMAELPTLRELRIPRCLFPSAPVSCHLMGFCDGSLKGSAAVLYLRVQFISNEVKLFLLKAKTRVAPTKIQTIPRLELAGAVLLSNLVRSVKPFMEKIPISNYSIMLFSDSTIVLSWIRKPPHLLKLFVSNRVTSILENTSISQWYHVSSEHNMGDSASRGLTPLELLSFTSWFDGPPWARKPLSEWPINNLTSVVTENLPEVKIQSIVLNTAAIMKPMEYYPSWINKYSKLSTLQRVTAYIFRFVNNSRSSDTRLKGPLSVPELKHALLFCIRCDQNIYFRKEIDLMSINKPCPANIQRLSPFSDESGLIRVGGRLKNSDIPYEARHPILLYNKSPLTNLIISRYHVVYYHVGPKNLQNILFQKFWFINSRSTIRQVIRKCVTCARYRSNNVSPPMGNLPPTRVKASRPFLHCGVDLAGPYLVKESSRRNARKYKAYFALFICFAIKAVHIEILTSLNSECFIAAVHRFTARRGLPVSIFSDQATNFKGAARKLDEISIFLCSSNTNPILDTYFSQSGIKFSFNVPRAPFMAGLMESNIKNVKYHLTRVIGHQTLTYEEFLTVTTRTEAILNSRPLCSMSSSPDDLKCLTPGHFLIGCPIVSPPEIDCEDVPIGRLCRWELVSQINRSFWRQWEREYLHTLQEKKKWFNPGCSNIQEGQLVWLKEDGSPPLSYPLGRIIQVHPGKDGVVRAATIKTHSGVYRRPIRKVAPLPSQ